MRYIVRSMYSFILQVSAYSFIMHTMQAYDLTLVGQVKMAESLPRLLIGIISALKNELKINVIPTPGYYDLDEIPIDIQKVIAQQDKTPGTVALLTDMLWYIYEKPALYVPSASAIKIAYSMLESNAIPDQWVTILNKEFDAVVVPDRYFIAVYKNSGVTIPIFVVPCGMYSDIYFKMPLKNTIHKPFVFGTCAAFSKRKNYKVLLKSFAHAFGNNPDVLLRIQGRAGSYLPKIEYLLKKYKLSNVELFSYPLTNTQLFDFMASLDCYVLLSRGEGFSLTPREALALGLPCIISNCTAQETICDTGFVKAVPVKRACRAYYACFNKAIGYDFTCTVHDASQAFLHMYNNYTYYLSKAHEGRKWAAKYLYTNLIDTYMALIKPENVILASEDKLENRILYTQSAELYKKYKTYIVKPRII